MSNELTEKKEPREASKAEKLNVAINMHNAVQLRAVAAAAKESARSNKAIEQNTRAVMHSNREIAQNTNQMVEIGKKMEAAQSKSVALLDSVDLGVRNLEQTTKNINNQLKEANDIARQNFLQTKLANEREEWRDERDRLEKSVAAEKEAYEQSLRDLLYNFSRRLELISNLEMTNLEFYFFTKQMLETVEHISADLLKSIGDKQFRGQVEDDLRNATNKFYDGMDEQDRSDLAAIEEIERTDENEKATKLLASLEKKLDRVTKLRDLQFKMRGFASGRMDKKAFRDFEDMCVDFEKELQKI